MADVTVMGAGVFGLSAAWEYTRRGARVQVIDPGGPGAGASGNPVGALAPHVPDDWTPLKALQFDALMAAPAFWADVEAAAGGGPGFARWRRLQPHQYAAPPASNCSSASWCRAADWLW